VTCRHGTTLPYRSILTSDVPSACWRSVTRCRPPVP